MFNTGLSTVTGQLDRRFLLNAFFPVGVVLLAIVSVAISSFTTFAAAASWWTRQENAVQVLLAIASVAVVFVLANALSNNMLWVTRLYEGYLKPKVLTNAARRYRYGKFEKAVKKGNVEKVRNEYPLVPAPSEWEHVLPTRLGNILRNGETYPSQRYGVDAIRVWPRLYHLIPDTLRESMASARASMESALAVAFLAGVFAPVAAVMMLASGEPTAWTLVVLWGAIAISVVAYHSALPAAASYSEHVRAAFDMHRLALLAQLQMPMPVTADEERYLWAHVVRFMIDGSQHVQRYVRPL
jgi:hypothetical protein